MMHEFFTGGWFNAAAGLFCFSYVITEWPLRPRVAWMAACAMINAFLAGMLLGNP